MAEIELSEAIGFPPILRGTVSASRWEGVVAGKGLAQAERLRNRDALQAAIIHAAKNDKFLELEPGLYQIEGASLAIPPSEGGFVWRGSKGSHIQQFSDNAPVLTIGSIAGGVMMGHADIRGFRLSYNDDQSGHEGASALRLGLMRNSILENVAIFADYNATGPLVKAHRGIEVVNRASAFGFFSNTLKDIFVAGAARHLMDISLLGTGSVFQNIYLTQGVTGHPAPIGGEALRIAGDADQYESVFENLNIEWCVAQVLMQMQNCRATSFIGCHIEGNRLIGWDPCLMQISTSQLNLSGFNILDLDVPFAGPGSRPPRIFRFYGACALTGNALQISWSAPGRALRKFRLSSPDRDDAPNERQTIAITDVTIRDVGGNNAGFIELDANLPAEDFPAPKAIERFVSRPDGLSRVEGATLSVNADMTVYAQLHEPHIAFPAALGARRVVTLSNRMKASGDGAAARPMSGAMVSVRRDGGDADGFALIVKNHDGAVLQTIASANTTCRFQFDGSNWAAVI